MELGDFVPVRSYIIRVYREAEKADGSVLIGVVENPRSEQRRFHGIEELGRILEKDRDKGDAFASVQRKGN